MRIQSTSLHTSGVCTEVFGDVVFSTVCVIQCLIPLMYNVALLRLGKGL